MKGTARWLANFQGEYRPSGYISLFGGYAFIYNHIVNGDGRIWQQRNKLFGSVMPRWYWKGFNFNYRLMYQMVFWGNSGDTGRRQMLRNRIYAEKPLDGSGFTPYAYYESFNLVDENLGLQYHQLTVGTNYLVDRHSRLGAFYRHIFRSDGKRPVNGVDVVGVSYTYRFRQ
ncbi:MAG: hypothetical protein C7K11_08780 [Candidatus Amulumruptor caecigallinarius]|nr:MAG: hypothetical protein C7K11_08780 [Candidatus Amulumruptor caecigallinarius]